METLLYRHVVPDIPQYTANNGKLCYSPRSPVKLSTRALMHMDFEVTYGFPFFAELPETTETSRYIYTYDWKTQPPQSITAEALNSHIADKYRNEHFYYNELLTTDTQKQIYNAAFNRYGTVAFSAASNTDFFYYQFRISLMWDSTLNYWEWFIPYGDVLWRWEITETRTDKTTGEVRQFDTWVEAEGRFDLLEQMPPSRWAADYGTAAAFYGGHAVGKLRLGNGLDMWANNMRDETDSGGHIINFQGTAFRNQIATMFASYA